MAQILFNFISPIRWIFMAIDSILFGLIDNCYSLIVSFANAELFTSDQISEIRTKIYFLITLIAFFRLAFLLVNSLINPEKLNDQNEGLSKIAFNFVIMLVLLVITPIIFNIALELQKDIVNENVITGIFTMSKASTYTCNVDQSELNKIKQENYKKYDAKSGNWVIDTEKYKQDIEYKKSALCSSAEMKALVISSLIYPDSRIATEDSGEYKKSSSCSGKCGNAVDDYNTMLKNRDFKFLTLEKYIGVTTKIDDSDVFVYNYTLIVTTICAGFMLYILLSFAFDLGKRLLEMNLLMILSPLFIATYVDPKSAKSGPFNNWLKAIGSSYAGLFLRLAALAVMMLFVKILSINKAGLEPIGGIGFIILLFAGLTFCKELPKWLSGLLGMKDGMGGLGLGKKIADTPLLGGAAKKAGLMATGAVAGAATSAAALGRQRRQLRAQARKDAGLGRVLNGHNKKNYGSYADLRKARRDAYDKAFEGAGLKRGAPGAIGQGLAGIGLGAKAGGTTGIKADNIKGAFKGSVQSSKQGLAGLGVTGGETLGQKIMTGIGIGTAALESQFGSVVERSDRVSKQEKDKKVKSVVSKEFSNMTSMGDDTGVAGELPGSAMQMKKLISHSGAKVSNFDEMMTVAEYSARNGVGKGDLKDVTFTTKDGVVTMNFPNGSTFKSEDPAHMSGILSQSGNGVPMYKEMFSTIVKTSIETYNTNQKNIQSLQESVNTAKSIITENLVPELAGKFNIKLDTKKIGEELGQAVGSELNKVRGAIKTIKENGINTEDDKKRVAELSEMERTLEQLAAANNEVNTTNTRLLEAFASNDTANRIINNFMPGESMETKYNKAVSDESRYKKDQEDKTSNGDKK